MDNDTAAGFGAVAQRPAARSADTAATPAASPFAGPFAPTPSSADAVSPHTMILPEPHPRRGRHAASHIGSDRLTRRLVVVAGVIFAASLATAATMLFTGGSADQNNAPPAAGSSVTAEATLDSTTEPALSPTATEPGPSPTATQRPRQRPADLIARIQGSLTQLARDGQLDDDAAEKLASRLDDVSRALADGETDEAWEKLRKVAEKLNELREEGDLTPTGYQALAASLTQLAQTFPPR